MNTDRLRSALLSRAFLTVAGSTLLLTWAFVGIAVLVEGRIVSGLSSRVPFYGLVFAIAFILALWKLDDRDRDGLTILIATIGLGVGAALLVGFATEGVFFTREHPGSVFIPELIVGFTTAAIMCTGLGIWGVRHWREFVTTDSSVETEPPEMEPLE